MKQGKMIKAGPVLAAVGIGLIFFVFVLYGLDPERMSVYSGEQVRKEFTDEEGFSDIRIRDSIHDIEIAVTDTRHPTIDYADDKVGRYEFEIKDGILSVRYKDRRKWYQKILQFPFLFSNPKKVTLFLPEKRYGHLLVECVSGTVTVEGLQAEVLRVKTVSGNIDCSEIRAKLEAETISGSIEIKKSTGKEMITKSTSGDIAFLAMKAEEELRAKSVSGDITFTETDAEMMEMECVSGSIKGEIVSPKKISAKSTSGSVELPETSTGEGVFRAETRSGDIKIKLKEIK